MIMYEIDEATAILGIRLTYLTFGFNPSQFENAPFLGTFNEMSLDTVELTKSTNSDKKLPSMSVMEMFPNPPGC